MAVRLLPHQPLEMTPAKSRLDIAETYLHVVTHGKKRDRIHGAIATEHQRTVRSVLEMWQRASLSRVSR